MLSRTEIERIATTLTRGNADQAETLYLQDIVLGTVSRETADELVFKGDTALLKFYQLDRFSDDLDFTARRELSWSSLIDDAVRDLENHGASVEELRTDESDESVTARLGIRGPLYTGDYRSLCFIRLEANTKCSAVNVTARRYHPQFADLPSFDLSVLDEAEILAEKIRALMTRRQPRDLYDSYHLLSKGVGVDAALVREKLGYYGLAYRPVEILDRANALERGWPSLEPLVYSDLPEFDRVIEVLERNLPAAA